VELLELGKIPINENNPSGDDIRFEPVFEELEGEIAKLSSPSASGADWEKISKLSQNILGGKSKNLLVAAYLSIALLKTKGMKGFAASVLIFKDMMENFWETMYPAKKRMRGRFNAVAWWMEKTDAAIQGCAKEKWTREEKESFISNLEGIDAFLSENMEDAPILRRMNESLGDLIEVEPEKAPEPPPPEEVPAAPAEYSQKSSPAPAPAVPATEITGDNPDKLLDQGLDILGKAASLYFKQGQLNPATFRVNRIAAWLGVRNLPPVNEGKTMVPPPDEEIVNLLNGMYQSRNWADLLNAAESRVRQFVFWLDLSRYVSEALEQLGNAAAGRAVAEESAAYTGRLPGIDKMSFSDGTPFANENTKEWLRSVAKKSGGAPSAGGAAGVEQSVDEETSNAMNAIKENRTGEGLNLFMAKMRQASSLRDRFIWELGLSRLLIRVNQPRLALPYFDEMLRTLDAYKVEQWEPALALEGLALILTGMRLQDEKNKDEELIERILNRISVLNPARALELI